MYVQIVKKIKIPSSPLPLPLLLSFSPPILFPSYSLFSSLLPLLSSSPPVLFPSSPLPSPLLSLLSSSPFPLPSQPGGIIVVSGFFRRGDVPVDRGSQGDWGDWGSRRDQRGRAEEDAGDSQHQAGGHQVAFHRGACKQWNTVPPQVTIVYHSILQYTTVYDSIPQYITVYYSISQYHHK